jgi:hypothetical protein
MAGDGQKKRRGRPPKVAAAPISKVDLDWPEDDFPHSKPLDDFDREAPPASLDTTASKPDPVIGPISQHTEAEPSAESKSIEGGASPHTGAESDEEAEADNHYASMSAGRMMEDDADRPAFTFVARGTKPAEAVNVTQSRGVQSEDLTDDPGSESHDQGRSDDLSAEDVKNDPLPNS